MENTMKRRKSWKPWSWKKHELKETNLSSQSSILKQINVPIPINKEFKVYSPIEMPKRHSSISRRKSHPFTLRKSPKLGSPTPNFREIPSTLSNSMLISMFDRNTDNLPGLSIEKIDNSILLFTDEQILSFPHQKDTIDTLTVAKKKEIDNDPKPTIKKSITVKHPLFTVRNMKLPETIKYSNTITNFSAFGEPDKLWNVWVEITHQGRTNLQVKKKVFDVTGIEELAEDYDYILEFYVHDKGHNLFLWPFGIGKPPIGKMKRQSKLEPFVFWVPLASGNVCWFGICKLLFQHGMPLSEKIVGVSWRGESDGYWLTIHSNGIRQEDEISLFLNELTLYLAKICTEKTNKHSIDLQRIFSAARTVDENNSVTVINI